MQRTERLQPGWQSWLLGIPLERWGAPIAGVSAVLYVALRILTLFFVPEAERVRTEQVLTIAFVVALGGMFLAYVLRRDVRAGVSLTPLIAGSLTVAAVVVAALLIAPGITDAEILGAVNGLGTVGAVAVGTLVYLWLRDHALALGDHPLRTLLVAALVGFIAKIVLVVGVEALANSIEGFAGLHPTALNWIAFLIGGVAYFGLRDYAEDAGWRPLGVGLATWVVALLLSVVLVSLLVGLIEGANIAGLEATDFDEVSATFKNVGDMLATLLAVLVYFIMRANALGFGLFHMFVNETDFALTPLLQLFGVQGMGYFFVMPNLLIFGIFILFPMLLNFFYGFTAGDSILPENREFIGTENLAEIFDCEDFLVPNSCTQDRFWRAVSNTTVFVVSQVTIMVFFALATALALNREIRGRAFFRSVFFYPVLLSPVVVALIWKWILQPQGVFNGLLGGLGMEAIPFLTDPNWARLWVIIVSVWAQMGFHMLILLAGLQAIPRSLYEAAQIDGAGPGRTFFSITLPLLMPTMTVVLVLSLIRAVQVFDQVFVLTSGGPGTATLYIVQYIFQTAFDRLQFGLAAAASLVLAVVLLLLTLGQLRLGRASELG